MRLLIVCFLVFLVPAGALLVTQRSVETIEGEFWADAGSQIQRLDRVTALYPPNVRKMRSAPAILQLKSMPSGRHVAMAACSSYDSPYRRLFDRLNTRCEQWTLFRRARWAALVGTLVAVGTLAIILMARIVVRKYAAIEQWPGAWTLWFVLRGMPVLLLGHVAASLLGFGMLLKDFTGKGITAAGLLLVPLAILFWIERRFVLAFVEPHVLAAFRPSGVSGPRRRRVGRPA